MKNSLLLLFTAFYCCTFSKNNIPETPFSEYKFFANECKVIQHNQSRIFIQPYTFYFEGKPYAGEVVLKYREFTDQLDIILNKIPMSYNANDKHHVLESAGMFELYAYGNGKLLSFAPNKKVQVQLATKFDMPGGETYILDKQNKVWKKATPFANLQESNQILSDNKNDLWDQPVWQNRNGEQEDIVWTGRRMDSIYVEDPNTGELTLSGVITFTSSSYDYDNEIRNQAFKTMSVDKMELYNCDRILNEQTVPMVADFTLQGYKEKLTSEIFVVYKNRNAVLTYYPNQFATDFKLLPNEDFTIFSFSKDGKLAVLDKQFAATFDAGSNAAKKVTFPMKVYDKNLTTKQELAALTGL